MKKSTLFILFSFILCFFVWRLHTQRSKELSTEISYYKSSKNHENLKFVSSCKQDAKALSPSQKSNQQDVNLPIEAEAPMDGGSQVVAQSYSKEKFSSNPQSVSSSNALISSQVKKRPNSTSDLLKTNLSQALQTHAVDVEIAVPSGASLPAAIVDSSNNLSAPQLEVMDSIAEEFLDSTAANDNSATKPSPPMTVQNKWSQSLNEANERYRSIFGVEAYNSWSSQAAKEALNDYR